MGSEWKRTTLGEASESVQTGPFGSQLHKSDYVEEGIPSIMPVNIGDNRIMPADIARITEEDAERLSKYRVEEGDVIYSRRGDVERRSLIREDEDGWLCGTGCLRVRFDKTILNPEYAAFQLGSPECREWIVRHAIGATMPNLNTSILSALPIVVPPLPEQKAIAHILGSLDDKIELNRRMNETLEGMAQALFKSWFVDFDPVIDNILAKNLAKCPSPNLSPGESDQIFDGIPDEFMARAETRRAALADGTANRETAKMFPDSFQETEEMGWIPAGWEERPIGDLFKLLGGHSFKSGHYIEDGTYGVVTIKNVQDGSFVQNCASRITVLPENMKEHCLLGAGNVLLSLTGNVGRVCLVSGGCYVLNQRVSRIVGVDGISEAFSYFYFRQKPLYEKMIVIAKGTAQLNLSPIETARLKQIMPSNESIMILSVALDAYYEKMIGNILESQTLSKLRDTLLPRLISGDFNLKELDQFTEGALT